MNPQNTTQPTPDAGATASHGGVQSGDKAPDFQLPNQKGEMVALHDFLGKQHIILYFYPKDNSSGCTAEACTFRDQYEVFKEAGAEVIGVSSDSQSSHEEFASQHHLPFILLSDAGGKVRKLYGVTNTLGLIPGRVTYVIDRAGTVRYVFSSQMNPKKHVDEALRILQGLS